MEQQSLLFTAFGLLWAGGARLEIYQSHKNYSLHSLAHYEGLACLAA